MKHKIRADIVNGAEALFCGVRNQGNILICICFYIIAQKKYRPYFFLPCPAQPFTSLGDELAQTENRRFFADGSTRPLPQDHDPHQDHFPGEEGQWFTMREQDVPALREKLGMGAEKKAPVQYSDTAPFGLDTEGVFGNYLKQRFTRAKEPDGLQWGEALGRFLQGTGKPVEIPFHTVDPGYGAQDFPEFGKMLQEAPIGRDIPIDAKKGYDTDGPTGRGVARLQGTLHKNADGTYKFFGGVCSYDDYWDFNRRPMGERDKGIPIKEGSIIVGSLFEHLGARPYDVHIREERPVQAEGKWE